MSKKQFASQGDLEAKQISFVELGPGAYAYTAEGDPNAGVIVGDDGVMVVDTLATPTMAKGLIEFIHSRYHGKEYSQVVEASVGPEHGAQLDQKNFWMIEREADPTTTQKGVVLHHREIREDLVTTHIERANGHRLWREGCE